MTATAVLLAALASAAGVSLLTLTGRLVLGGDLAGKPRLVDGLVSLAVGALLGGRSSTWCPGPSTPRADPPSSR